MIARRGTQSQATFVAAFLGMFHETNQNSFFAPGVSPGGGDCNPYE